MKSKIQFILSITVAFVLVFVACKKNSSVTDVSTDTELSAQADDQARVSNESDEIADDANSILDDYSSINGRIGNICSATAVVDSTSNPKKITVTYNGPNCQGTSSRTGVLTISIPSNAHWKDSGAVLTINIQNLKITRLSDNKSITINGTKTITNVTGGRISDLSTRTTITHLIASDGLRITFDGGAERVWQSAEKRVFTYNNGVVITTTGTHTDGNVTRICDWGTNRFGHDFVTAITEPFVIRQDCNFRIVSGRVTHTESGTTATATFGLDAAGNATSCPAGTYFFKLVWTGLNGISKTIILPY